MPKVIGRACLSVVVSAAMWLLPWCVTGVAAQGPWEALLTIDPYPSPYYSDWDVDPDMGSLTVFNHGASAGDVRVAFTIVDQSNRVIASGTSEPQRVPGAAAAIFDSPYEVAGVSRHDAELERIAERTGRLPEGSYTACAAATDLDGFLLAEACGEFTILYPDPPLLLGPVDGAVLDRQDEFFQWSPVQVPVQFQPQYVLRIAEVLEGQTPPWVDRSPVTLGTTLGTLIGGVVDNGDGTYVATLRSEAALGVAVVSGVLAGVAIQDTAGVTFRPGDPSDITTTITADSASLVVRDATGDGEASLPPAGGEGVTIQSAVVVATSSTPVTVQVLDAWGNPTGRSAGTVTLSTTLGVLDAVMDHEDGTYTATLTTGTTLGLAVVSGTLNGEAIADTAGVLFRAPPGSPATTTITADSTAMNADGTSTSRIKVRVLDAWGQPVTTSAGTVTLATTLGSIGPVTDHQNGTYTAELTAGTDTGTAVVTGTLEGEDIADTAEVAFGPP